MNRDSALSEGIRGRARIYLVRVTDAGTAGRKSEAHAGLDAAVLEAYGFGAGGDLLAQLLGLNLGVAGRIEKGLAVTAPGVPAELGDVGGLVTGDCIRAGEE